MTVLIFFVIISMGMTGVQLNGVVLPKSVNSANEVTAETAEDAAPFVIGLTREQVLVIDGKPTSLSELEPAINAYFASNPEGSLMLKADRTLPYDTIAVLLSDLRKIGGRRVSLAVE